jgi:Fe-S-cluster containining protein
MQKLPLYAERAVAEVQAIKTAISSKYEWELRRAVAEIKTAIMCTPGCHYCCHYPVVISVFEGLPIYRYLVSRGQWTPSLKKTLSEHAAQTFGLASPVWFLSNIACPFLDKTGRCSIYKVRPFACRVTYTINDPQFCHTHNLAAGSEVVPRADALREFHTAEEHLFRQNRAHRILMPVSKAALVAELFASGNKPFESLDTYMSKEFEDFL